MRIPIISKLIESRAEPKNSFFDRTYSFFFGSTTSGKEKAVEHNIYRLLEDEPNKEMTSLVFRETLMSHLLLWGNAYAQIIGNGKGEVVSLYPLKFKRSGNK